MLILREWREEKKNTGNSIVTLARNVGWSLRQTYKEFSITGGVRKTQGLKRLGNRSDLLGRNRFTSAKATIWLTISLLMII